MDYDVRYWKYGNTVRQYRVVWTGFFWLRTETKGGLVNMQMNIYVPSSVGNLQQFTFHKLLQITN
jgi:hypothetical protein